MDRCPKDEPTAKNLVCKKALPIREKFEKPVGGRVDATPPPPPPAIGGLNFFKNFDYRYYLLTIYTIVSQLSKCLKFITFQEGWLVIHVECKYLSEVLETLSPSVYKKWNKIISVNWMIMMRHSVNNNTRMGLAIFLCSYSNHLISLIPPNGLKF